MPSVAGQIQGAVVELLEGAVEGLAIDDREVSIARVFPRSRHGGKMPLVVVERPFVDDSGNWSSGPQVRDVYTLPIGIVDGGGATADKVEEAKERIEALWENVRRVLVRSRHWGLEEFDFFSSFARYDVGEYSQQNNNLLLLPVSITVPVIVSLEEVEPGPGPDPDPDPDPEPEYSELALDYFARLEAVGAHLPEYDEANAWLIDTLDDAGLLPAGPNAAFVSMVGRAWGTGQMIPLRDGQAVPTNVGFVSSDHSPLTGLMGGGTKNLVSGLLNNSRPQNDFSMSCWVTALHSNADFAQIMGGDNAAGRTQTVKNTLGQYEFRSRIASVSSGVAAQVTGFLGQSRESSPSVHWRVNASSGTLTEDSSAPNNSSIVVFGRPGPTSIFNGGLSYYHIGPALDLAVMRTILDEYMDRIAAV
jgi:hypothetical protein